MSKQSEIVFTDMKGIREEIRIMTAAEASAVRLLLASCTEAAQWLPTQAEADLKDGLVFVAEANGEIVGMAAARAAVGEAELLNIAVRAEHRRGGIARRLLEAVIATVKDAGAERMFLEVRASNAAARAFYSAMGFVEIAVRRNYYSGPVVDALVLSMPLV